MIILKRKIFSILIVFILAIFSLILFLNFSLVRDIRESSRQFDLQRKALILFQKQLQEFEDFKSHSGFYQSNLEAIEKLFVDPEAPVDFIQFLEEESQNLSLLIKISPAQIIPKEKDPWQSIGFRVSLTGSSPNCLKFLEKLQASPWLLEIQRIEARRISEKELQSEELKDFSLGDIFFSIILKVYTKEYDFSKK